jgi:serine phosphatase RsbU (regulator of sigma subunit)
LISLSWGLLAFAVLLWSLGILLQADLKLPNLRITGASIEFSNEPMPPRDRSMLEKGTVVLLAIGMTFAFRKIGRDGHDYIAARFYRGKYDYRRAGSELAEVMSTRLNMQSLAQGIVQKIAELMHLKRVGVIFFRNQKTCCCQEAYGFDGETWKEVCVAAEHDIAAAMQEFKGPFRTDYLPAPIKDEFTRHEFRYVIPIRSKEKIVGALLVGEKLSETPFHQEDLEFLGAAATQASVAIENAFLYEELAEQERMKHELEIARRIQMESLPQTTPEIQGLDIAGVSVPAMEVGGDYFDYLNGAVNSLTVIVGDVSGKGTSAALYMSKVQGIMRSLHGFGLSPRELFIRANQLLCGDIERKSFVTAIGGAFDVNGRDMLLARAGHLPLYYYRASEKKVKRIIPRGLGLGLSPEELFATELEEERIHYSPGDVFLFVSDGVTEGKRSSGEEFGEERVMAVLGSSANSPAEGIRDELISSLRLFTGNEEQHDDQTVVVVKAT